MNLIPVKEINSRPPDAARPKASVAMITYNHEKFLAQAVESVMAQETRFAYELVLSEDCSSDRTREIALALQRKYPDRIRLLLPERNLGLRDNWQTALRACAGDYIAILEGDDYWTSVKKLQAQVDLLEQRPDLSGCFARVEIVGPSVAGKQFFIPADDASRAEVTTDDLIKKNDIATCSLVFRNVVRELDFAPFQDVLMCDWPLSVMLSVRGPIGYLNGVMAAYRQHNGGVWTGRALSQKLAETIRFYQVLRRILPSRYHRQVNERIVKTNQLAALELLRDGDRRSSRGYAWRSLASVPWAQALGFRWYIKRSAILLLGSFLLPFQYVERTFRT